MTAKRRRPATWSFAMSTGLAAGVLGVAGSASAQPAASIDRHHSAVLSTDGVGINSAETTGDMRWGANLQLDYANDPLVLEQPGSTTRARVVSHQLRAHMTGSLTIADRAVVFVGLPLDLLLIGQSSASIPNSVPGASHTSLGDPYVGARVRLLGTTEDTFMLALQGSVSLPLAQMIARPTYSGDQTVGGRIHILPQLNLGMARIVFDVGANMLRRQNFPSAGFDSEVFYGVGLTLKPADSVPLSILAEVHGSTSMGRAFDREQTPLEGLVGVRYTHEDTGLSFGGNAGMGMSAAAGTPDYRIIGSVGWQQNPNSGDSDHDGIVNRDDQCRDDPEDMDGFEDANGCPDPDNDADGILDGSDQCPNDAEDTDSFEDENGCPDPDNDADGLLDGADQCPIDPEDMDGFEDENGCSDPDNDADQVPDAADGAPLEPEDRDGFEDENGIPDPDNDADGLSDTLDNCPNEAGVVANQGCPDRDRDGDTVVDRLDNCPDEAGTVQNQGCRARQMVTIESDRIAILTRIFFATGRATIQSRSFPLLDQISAVLRAHPEITSIRIEGHTDNRGNLDDNMRLSQERAQAVLDYLSAHGVDASRLRAQGFGPTQPRVENPRNNRELEQNRRVEFVIEGR